MAVNNAKKFLSKHALCEEEIMLLKDKVILITGAATGIGRETALLFAREGANLALLTRKNKSALDEVSTKIKLQGNDIFSGLADVANKEEVENFVINAANHFGKIDGLVCAAGLFEPSPFLENNEQVLKRAIDVNMLGVWHITKAVAPYIINQGGGSMVAITSSDAFTGCVNYAPYSMAKAGIVGMYRTIALELGSKNVRCNMIAPGITDTALVHDRIVARREKYLDESALKRIGTPADIANACLYLSSNMSLQITGQVLHINGGCYF